MKRTIGISLVTGELVEFFDATVCPDRCPPKAGAVWTSTVPLGSGKDSQERSDGDQTSRALSVASNLSMLRRVIWPERINLHAHSREAGGRPEETAKGGRDASHRHPEIEALT